MSEEIRKARATMVQAFKEDPGFKLTYIANIAMLLHDRYDITDYETRNRAADDLLKLIFES